MLRVYVDTSVFGGCFDTEFKEESKRFFKFVNQNLICVLISPILLKELENAPDEVKNLLDNLLNKNIEFIELDNEVIAVRNSYLEKGVLSERWIDDATHVTLATCNRADAIVSWNFLHIVRLDKIKMFNQINLLNSYQKLTIISPKEVFYEDYKKN